MALLREESPGIGPVGKGNDPGASTRLIQLARVEK
jgi:hypothetical protein